MRRYFVVLLLVALLAGPGCAKKPPQEVKEYSFPLSRADLEAALAENDLQWQVLEEQAASETLSGFNLEDKDGVQLTIITIGTATDRKVQLTAKRFAMFGDREDFLKGELPALIELVGGFYGDSSEAGKVYKEFRSKAAARDWELQWPKRVGDNHYNLDFKAYGPINFVIDNQASYERSQKIEADQMIESLKTNGVKFSTATVKEIDNKRPTEKREQFFLVKGRLEKIKKVSAAPNESIHPNDCRRAMLVDETGSMEVYLFVSTLTEKELQEERNHYLMYYPTETPYSLIYVSAPVE